MNVSRSKNEVFERLCCLAGRAGCSVKLLPFKAYDGRIKGKRIGIRQDMSIDDINYNLAHELAHLYLHYDKGTILSNAISKEKYQEYEEQADRAARLLLSAVSYD